MREKLNSLEAFKALQEKCSTARENEKRTVLVCCGTGCAAGGNLAVYEELKAQILADRDHARALRTSGRFRAVLLLRESLPPALYFR